ncbi:hypothetical protein NIA73_01570 [Anaerobutyricum hallii]|nr:hypothetical protein [Anaerobutyricum hallii]
MNFTAVHKEGAKETVPEEQMEQNLPEDKMQGNKREETIAKTSITGKEDQGEIPEAKKLRFWKKDMRESFTEKDMASVRI